MDTKLRFFFDLGDTALIFNDRHKIFIDNLPAILDMKTYKYTSTSCNESNKQNQFMNGWMIDFLGQIRFAISIILDAVIWLPYYYTVSFLSI